MEELLNKMAYFELIELHTYLLYVYFYLIISTKSDETSLNAWWSSHFEEFFIFSFLSKSWQKLLSILQLQSKTQREKI